MRIGFKDRIFFKNDKIGIKSIKVNKILVMVLSLFPHLSLLYLPFTDMENAQPTKMTYALWLQGKKNTTTQLHKFFNRVP